jgi:hypothetical protein
MATKIDWNAKKSAWIARVTDLCAQVKRWAEQENWGVIETPKQVEEDHIGVYQVPSLVLQSPQCRVYLDPIGRDIIGAEGRVDIFTWPTMNRMLLLRTGDEWSLVTDARVAWPQPWGKETFLDIVGRLAEAQ